MTHDAHPGAGVDEFGGDLSPEEIWVLERLTKEAAEYAKRFVRTGRSDSRTTQAYVEAVEATRELGDSAGSAIKSLERAIAESRQAHQEKSRPNWRWPRFK